jgi:hypothetical protein
VLATRSMMRYDENMKQLFSSGRFVVALVIIVILVLVVLGLNARVAELRIMSEEVVRYEERVQALEHTKMILETQIAYATSDPPVAKWAMEDMRWVRSESGEKLIVPRVDPNATPIPKTIEIAPEDHPQYENWQFWLALFFDETELP